MPHHIDGRDNDHDDDEALFAQLEEEIENDELSSVREGGIEALRRELERANELKVSNHGQYTEIMVEKEVMNICAREPRCVAHFYHPDFKRCEIMDKHLAVLAQKYTSTRFIRVFVENVPWLVHKLSIQVLPCVICFVDGATKDRLIGFEELGNADVFQTAVLELKLKTLGVVYKEAERSELVYKIANHTNKQATDDDDVFDLDD